MKLDPENTDNRTFRNHVTVIADHLVVIAVAVIVMWIFTRDDMGPELDRWFLVALLALLLVVTFWSFFWLKRTTYTFTDTEIVRVSDTVFKSTKNIQYTRLASVTVRRSVLNRIFGTSQLLFNINSSVNSMNAEMTLVLRKDIADLLRDRLNSLIFDKDITVQEDSDLQTMVSVSNGDIIMHAIFAQPTYQSIFGFLMLVYAVVMLFYDNSGGFWTALLLFGMSNVLPFIGVILKYFNYRIYRVGDTITVESGLLSTTRRSFKVNKINSVRVRQPLLARMLGKATLEAEVVGMSDSDETAPMICPLKDCEVVEGLMEDIAPEIFFDSEPEHQPRSALVPMAITSAVFSVAVVAFFAVLLYYAETYLVGLSDFWTATVRASEISAAVLIPILIFGRMGLVQRHRTFAMGKDSFMLVYGGYDISTEFMLYDKVQYVAVTSGPLQRPFGVATCTVNMMSSVGFKQMSSGLFPPEDLERLSDEVMARIRDGRYDYRRYQ